MPMLTVADAEPEDLEEIRALLREAGLNDDGVDGCLAGFIVAREGPRLIATACLEDCGAAGLLRSVAVHRQSWSANRAGRPLRRHDHGRAGDQDGGA